MSRPSAPSAQNRHGRILTLPLSDLIPAKVNDLLYKPVDENDPEIIGLAASIREKGVLTPFAITRDNVILSGHRRRVACVLAGIDTVPCTREDILSTDEGFLSLLRDYNRQRVKSADEILREELVSVDADDAYANLRQQRRRAAQVSVQTVTITGTKHRAEITAAKEPFLGAIERVLIRLRNFWPVSDRQIHYQLLNAPPLLHASKPDSCYRNDQKSYKSLCELLTRARIAGRISWEAIHDPTRPVSIWTVHSNIGPFIQSELKEFLAGYFRNLQQSQPNHIEIIGEKNTVASIINPVAADYCIPVTLGRGYSSVPPRYEMSQRFAQSGKEQLILLFLSDLDPEGEDIPHSFARSMRDDFGINNVKCVKVALTGNQVDELNLPPGLTAKEGSSRRQRFVDQHGENVYELEAVAPEQLQQMLRQAVESVLNMDLYTIEQDNEKRDATYLTGVRRTVNEMLADLRLGQN